MDNIKILTETPEDYWKVEEVTREAFWNLYIPGCSEHLLAHKLRTHKDFVPELTFLIEVDNEIVGSIFYSKAKIICSKKEGDGTTTTSEYPIITFGPVSIHPKYHRKGLGRKLITHSIEEAKKLGYKALVIQGYPHHYKPYGFVSAKKFGISAADGKFYQGTQALPLQDGALVWEDKDNDDGVTISRIFQFADAFDQVGDPAEIDEFDTKFPSKEKGFQQSQKDFEAAVQMLDEE